MKRTIPDAVIRELNREASANPVLVFMTIDQESLFEPIRVVSDPRNFILDGKEFVGFEFSIKLLSDTEEAPRSQLTIQNVDKRIGEGVLRAETPPRVTIEVIDGSQFNLDDNPCTELYGPGNAERIYSAPQLFLTEVEFDAFQVTAQIVSWDYTQELWPGILATKSRLPGLFR